MTSTVEELEARVKELEAEVTRLRSAAVMPVTGTIAVGVPNGRSHTVLGAEEMVLQVGPDDAVGYVNAPMAKLLGSLGDIPVDVDPVFAADSQKQ